MLGLLALLVSTEFAAVHGRALRSTTKDNVVVNNPGCEEQNGTAAAEAVGGVSSFAVSENNRTSTRNAFRSLAFRLASGPSKKGPGH